MYKNVFISAPRFLFKLKCDDRADSTIVTMSYRVYIFHVKQTPDSCRKLSLLCVYFLKLVLNQQENMNPVT